MKDFITAKRILQILVTSVEHCFICNADMNDVAAYLTGQRFTICEKCLILTTEEYNWKRDDVVLEKIQFRNLPPHDILSNEELGWDVQHSLVDVPNIRESQEELSPEIVRTLLRMFDTQGILTFEV